MIDDIGLPDQLADQRRVGDAAADLGQPRVRGDGVEVGPVAGRFVVDHDHPLATRQEGFGEVTADKPGSAGHQMRLHACSVTAEPPPEHARPLDRQPPPRKNSSRITRYDM